MKASDVFFREGMAPFTHAARWDGYEPDEVQDGGEWTLTEAVGINEHGVIVGNGMLRHHVHGFMPVPQAGH